MKFYLLGWAILTLASTCHAQETKVIRVGIIGLDTSHSTAFTGVLNKPDNSGDLAGFKVVAAYPGGSPDLPISRDRIKGFTTQLRDKHGVEIVDSIEELLQKVDVVLLESVDGRVHLAQATPVLKARKPLFIDKPLAASLGDALQIMNLATENKTPVFSCSSLRFGKKIRDLRSDVKVGDILGCMTFGPCSVAEHHPDLSFYGVHGLEMLYAIMGPGCKNVARTSTPDFDIVTCVWADGRIGSYRGMRKGKSEFGATVFAKHANMTLNPYEGYTPMLVEVCKFLRTGITPVSPDEMLEVIAIIDAADESKQAGGAPVSLESVFQKARARIEKK